MWEPALAKCSSPALLFHLVIALARPFTDHKKSVLPRISGNFSNGFRFFSFDVAIIHIRCRDFVLLVDFHVCQLAQLFPTYVFASLSTSNHQAMVGAWDLSQPGTCLTIPAETSDSSKSLLSCAILKFGLRSRRVHSKYWFSEINLFHYHVSHAFHIVFLSSQCYVVNKPLSRCVNKHFCLGLFHRQFRCRCLQEGRQP